MLILMSLVLLAIGAAMLFSLFNVLNPFIDTLGDIKNYNVAYYGAIASIERAELAIRKHKPGFEGESGWEGAVNDFGYSKDGRDDDFGLLARAQNGMSWKIESRAKNDGTDYVIPYPRYNNIEPQMAGTGSENFNAREREYEPEIYLHIDNDLDTDNYYKTSSSVQHYNGDFVDAKFKLPPKVRSELGDLTNSESQEVNGIGNDIIVLWTLLGETDSTPSDKFTIQPNIDVNYTSNNVRPNDSAIRESDINNINKVISFHDDRNPVQNNSDSQYAIPENIVIGGSNIKDSTFSHIFENSKNQIIKFSQINNLISNDNNIYPYLEYQFKFDEVVADRFYTITGTGKAGKYLVELEIKKPTAKSKKYGDITVAN